RVGTQARSASEGNSLPLAGASGLGRVAAGAPKPEAPARGPLLPSLALRAWVGWPAGAPKPEAPARGPLLPSLALPAWVWRRRPPRPHSRPRPGPRQYLQCGTESSAPRPRPAAGGGPARSGEKD